ncbi:proline iminopeptidase [Actinokineospora bangkokensis]|uniref:Proline iminopeptidase n=2 Tax=Actinokineospora bangkokensis TaxID=1193682 RepID=A0A1Q9LPK0_9PSEU|nr:proline iminopeptidase [Actinokineospora bangkokensis]
MTTDEFTLREHRVPVPLDHSDPDGPTIEVFAQEVVARGREHDDLPWLLFLQGGPGAPSPPPAFAGGWLTTALEDHRVLLFDQRGGGRSAPITASTMAGRTDQEIAAHVTRFRADSIVRDAEVLRARVAGGAKWTLLGQSYGGFLALTYLSLAPEALSAVLISGGVPPLGATADEVYRHTYAELLRKNSAYFAEHPDDADLLKRLAAHLDTHDVRLPDGARLTSRRLRLVGRNLGMSNGPDRVHAVLRQAWDGDRVSEGFLRAVAAETGFTDAQLYALQEFLYAGPDRPTRWAAHRVLAEFPELTDADPPLLIGEMIYPWMFEEFTELRPFAGAAHLLAEESDWPDLYDLDRLAANDVPVAALVYDGDLYTPVELQLRATPRIGAARVVRTGEFHHNGMMRNGELLTRLLEVVRGDGGP